MEQKVREMDLYDTFEHCDYNICYVGEVLDSVKLSPEELMLGDAKKHQGSDKMDNILVLEKDQIEFKDLIDPNEKMITYDIDDLNKLLDDE